jgi:BMFP domain-containing protein YqiC
MNHDDVMRFDKDIYEAACVLAKTAPLDLNEAHFDQLRIISTHSETRAREAQKAAQLAIVQAHTEKAATLQTKAAPAAERAIKDWVNKDGTRTVSYKTLDVCLDSLFAVLRPMLAKERDRVKALEQRVTEQDNRILELEAALASRTVNQ